MRSRGYSRVGSVGAVFALAIVLAGSATVSSRGDVVVLANRTESALSAVVTPEVGLGQQRVMVPAGDSVPVFVDGRSHVDFASRGRPKRYQLDANAAYFLGRGRDGGTDLQKIGLGEDASTAQGRSLPASTGVPAIAVIPVKILVDEEEPGRQLLWERRLRARIEAASAILERACGVRLNVVAVSVWNSDNSIHDFVEALGEFERKVQPFPGRLAIGFSSQFHVVRGRMHMAGTRGPLHSHILIRDGSPQVNETERLEFLLHELGHYLGASHSPERNSVMRPVLGDNQAGRPGFRVRFDPVNTLIMSLFSEEIRRNGVQHVSSLSAGTRRRLRQIYSALSEAIPNDPAGMRYMQMMDAPSSMPVSLGAKQVLQELVRAAMANQALPPSGAGDGRQSRLEGDALTGHYVRAAARAASTLPGEIGPSAFVLALGIALDDSDTLVSLPNTAGLAAAVETSEERARRIGLIGSPTIQGRRDLAQHFFVSAHLTAAMGRSAAESAGLAKEFLDATGTSGFSFADVAADRAGCYFANMVLEKRLTLPMLTLSFSTASFMPSIDGLPEKLSAAAVTEQFGANDDDRFQRQLQNIDLRISNLPPYRQIGPILRP